VIDNELPNNTNGEGDIGPNEFCVWGSMKFFTFVGPNPTNIKL